MTSLSTTHFVTYPTTSAQRLGFCCPVQIQKLEDLEKLSRQYHIHGASLPFWEEVSQQAYIYTPPNILLKNRPTFIPLQIEPEAIEFPFRMQRSPLPFLEFINDFDSQVPAKFIELTNTHRLYPVAIHQFEQAPIQTYAHFPMEIEKFQSQTQLVLQVDELPVDIPQPVANPFRDSPIFFPLDEPYRPLSIQPIKIRKCTTLDGRDLEIGKYQPSDGKVIEVIAERLQKGEKIVNISLCPEESGNCLYETPLAESCVHGPLKTKVVPRKQISFKYKKNFENYSDIINKK